MRFHPVCSGSALSTLVQGMLGVLIRKDRGQWPLLLMLFRGVSRNGDRSDLPRVGTSLRAQSRRSHTPKKSELSRAPFMTGMSRR